MKIGGFIHGISYNIKYSVEMSINLLQLYSNIVIVIFVRFLHCGRCKYYRSTLAAGRGADKTAWNDTKAVTEIIRICKDRNVLREYLLDREREVVTIMMSLFDEEQIMKSFIKSERYEETKENARRLLKLGKIKIDEVSDCFPDLIDSDIKELEAEIMQLA